MEEGVNNGENQMVDADIGLNIHFADRSQPSDETSITHTSRVAQISRNNSFNFK